MAESVNVAGPVACKIGTGSGSPPALELIGYTVNGVDIDEQRFLLDVHGDQHGGDAGPPIDIQDMGKVDIIRMDFSKFDSAIVDKIRPGLRGKVAGEVLDADIGALIFAGGYSYRLVLDGTNFDRDYHRVVFRDPISINQGTKHSICRMVAYAYRDPAPSTGNARVYDANIAALATPEPPRIVDIQGSPIGAGAVAEVAGGAVAEPTAR